MLLGPIRWLMKGVIAIVSLMGIFHILVLANVIPQEQVLGGWFSTASDWNSLETMALIVNTIVWFILMNRIGYIHVIHPNHQRLFMWITVVLYAVNTVGNAFASSNLEQFVFAPLTGVLTVCLFILARSKA